MILALALAACTGHSDATSDFVSADPVEFSAESDAMPTDGVPTTLATYNGEEEADVVMLTCVNDAGEITDFEGAYLSSRGRTVFSDINIDECFHPNFNLWFE